MPGPTVATPIDLGAVPVRDFDPAPGDGRERSATVPNAVDGDAGTVWETERYSTGQFGGLKGGVGLLLEKRVGQIASQGWEFYAVTGALFIVLAFPGFTWRYLLKHRQAQAPS